jgi:hypothetical protein
MFSRPGYESDVAMLAKNNVPEQKEVDIVSELEKELRAEKKDNVETNQSQQLGGSGAIRPDMPGDNEYLKAKVAKYAQNDNVRSGMGTRSILADFSTILDMQSHAALQNSSLARNQTMAMAYSTLQAAAPQAERVIESQMSYNLAATTFGLADKSQKSYKRAIKSSKLGNNAMYR